METFRLTPQSIAFAVLIKAMRSDGKDYIVWDPGAGDAIREFMESRGSAECKGKVAADKGSSAPC